MVYTYTRYFLKSNVYGTGLLVIGHLTQQNGGSHRDQLFIAIVIKVSIITKPFITVEIL